MGEKGSLRHDKKFLHRSKMLARDGISGSFYVSLKRMEYDSNITKNETAAPNTITRFYTMMHDMQT